MSITTRVALDAMGGDNAPYEIIKGAVKAVYDQSGIQVLLTGKKEILEKILSRFSAPKNRIRVVDAREVIENSEPPVMAIRRKKDSSICVALSLVKNGEADAFVSAGSSGAILVGSLLIVGKIAGVERVPLAPLIPTRSGVSLLVDCGANVDARPRHLVQFARMGSIYIESVMKRKAPTVALVNIGAEEEKGNALVKETFPLLKNCRDIHFVGSIEARDIPAGKADVVVCEAFVGNVILKLYEGLGLTLISRVKSALHSSPRSRIGGLLAKPALTEALKDFDVTRYGGAPLLGLKGLVLKTHGNATSKEIYHSILQCAIWKKEKINEKIIDALVEGSKTEDPKEKGKRD